MRRADVIARLKSAEPDLRRIGVEALYLFGSHARDEGRLGSDVDVFVDAQAGRDFGFIPYMEALERLQLLFGEGIEIGYSTREGLSTYLKRDIEQSAMQIF